MAVHKFLPNSGDNTQTYMLKKLGLGNIEELFSDVPESVRLNRQLKIPDGLSEIELEKFVGDKLAKNKSAPEYLNFIGGGNWVHHVPSVIDEILSRGEFYTAYTQYQPEISQGMLQALFEYQSQICDLTEMDVANSSMYDWATALGEAGRMASRINGRKKILFGANCSPERIGVLRTYCSPAGITLEKIEFDKSGRLDFEDFRSRIDETVSAIYVENPNFLGIIEDSVQQIADACHAKGALLIAGVNPITLGILRSPGSYSADIVVGDGQPLGIYPNFGGPLMGILATKEDQRFLRQMPGRLIGMTFSRDGTRRGYTMVLQTREQHIRREHATSNICTNEALFAIAVSIFLSTMGPNGMKELGERIVSNSHYAMKRLREERLDAPHFSGPFFGELTVKTRGSCMELPGKLVQYGILGGLPLGRFYESLQNTSLFSFSEIHTQQDIEKLVSALGSIEGTGRV